MGSHNRYYSSVTTTVGISVNSIMKQFLVIASVAALGACTPVADADPAASPDADAFYGQYQWPGYGVVTPYGAVSSTCYGCRPYHFIGKRSAEAHGLGVAVHPGVATSFVGPTTYGLPHHPIYYGKRSADAEPHGVAVHPVHATSYVGRTIYGYPRLHYGKRDAEPHGLGLGVAVHPGVATSYVGPTTHGLPHLYYGKRDAEPEAAPEAEADADAFYYGHYGYPLAYGGYGYGFPGGYTSVSGVYGYGYPYAYWG